MMKKDCRTGALKAPFYFLVGLLVSGENHSHDYFDQYPRQDFLTCHQICLTCAPLCHLFCNSGEFYKVQLPSSLAAGAQLKTKVEMTFSHVLKPFPTYITQAERQLVIFQGDHYFYSPYPTRTQTTRVRLASKTVESYTKLGNPSKTDEIIEYGPFRNIAPFSEVQL